MRKPPSLYWDTELQDLIELSKKNNRKLVEELKKVFEIRCPKCNRVMKLVKRDFVCKCGEVVNGKYKGKRLGR